MDCHKLCFFTEWHDPEASIVRHFLLSFFTVDGTVEMYNTGNNKLFLKRIHLEGLREKDLYVGNTVTILSRKLTVMEYADRYTKEYVGNKLQKNVIFLKSSLIPQLGAIFNEFIKEDLNLMRMKLVSLPDGSKQKLKEIVPSDMWNVRGSVVAIEMNGEDVNDKLSRVFGKFLSRRIVLDSTTKCVDKNDVFFFEDRETANLAAGVVFAIPARRLTHGLSDETRGTCCIVRPHAIISDLYGDILTDITSSEFRILGISTVHLDTCEAEAFLEVYRGVVPEFQAMVTELTSGSCIVMEVTYKCPAARENIVQDFRQFIGPSDPEIGRLIRPNSLRAKYGIDKVRNAVHCTDLSEDGALEVRYFFSSD